jgi:uncharacterized protein (TIGR03083 family)
VTTTTTINSASRLGHLDAMRVGTTEYDRFVEVLRSLGADDWGQPTDCTLWDVKSVVAHNLANREANASTPELLHQMWTAGTRAKVSGNTKLDEMTALQVEERSTLTAAELCRRFEIAMPRALKGRRRVPAVMRRLVTIDVPPPFTSMTLGFLIDTIYNRDLWMHRVDICRATGREMVLDEAPDGRLVAAIVYDWAARHGQPYDLVLDGRAGGVFRAGNGGQQIRLDAVEFCRIVSGRDANDAVGLLQIPVLY